MPVTHQFVSGIGDGTTADEVRSTHWNAAHIGSISGSTAALPEVLTRVFNFASSNTSAVSTIMSYSIPARALGIDRMVRWTAVGDIQIGSTAVVNSYTIEALHGGSSRWKDINSTLAAVVTRSPFSMQTIVAAANSSGTRFMHGTICHSSGGTATFGIGDLVLANAGGLRHLMQFASSATFTITTGAAEVFAIRFNWSGANSSLSFRIHYGVLELI